MNTKKIYLIGEVAQGFEGKLDLALKHIDLASQSKIDAIKFQMVFADDLSTIDYKYYKLYKSLELDYKDWILIKKKCKKKKIDLILDIFGNKSLKIARKINPSAIKIHPTDIDNYEFLKKINNSSLKKIILGIGGSYINEILYAKKILKNKRVVLMLGIQNYPNSLKDNYLYKFKKIKEISKLKNSLFGFADHTDTKDNNYYEYIAAICFGLGVTYFEKHFTINRNLKLEDYETAIEPKSISEFAQKLKNFSLIYGANNFKKDFLSKNEKKYRFSVRRSPIANKFIKKGKKISYKNISLKRTNKNSQTISFIMGRKTKKDILKNEIITKSKLF